MKKRFTFCGAFALLLGASMSCGDQAVKNTSPAGSANAFTPIGANAEHVVSPLAQLMRDMTAFADSNKHRLERGEELLPKPEAFKNMLTAEPTPGMVDHRVFDPFAFAYLHQLDSLYKVVPAQRQQAFDELVQYCAACHGQVCPGPLTRINKLRLGPAPH